MSNRFGVYRNSQFGAVYVFVISLLFFMLFIGSYSLLTPDEARYVGIAQSMFASGDFITPHLNGTVFLDKPILFYWSEVALIKLFGAHEWSVRLLPALMGSLGCSFIYVAARCLYNHRTAIISTVILMTSSFYFLMAHYADMDLMVATFIAGSLWFFIIAQQPSQMNRQKTWMWMAYACAALGFLTKGLIAIVFPMMIIGAWIVLRHRWRVLANLCLPTGGILFLFIVTPWLLLAQHANPEFARYFFVVQQFSRFVSTQFNMHQPISFYPMVIVAGMLPWSLFMFQALLSVCRSIIRNWNAAHIDTEMYLILWPLLVLVFFSIPTSKLLGYILPVFPPLALIVGRYLDQKWAFLSKSWQLRLCSIVFSIIMVVLAFVLIHLTQTKSLAFSSTARSLWAFALMLLISALLVLVYGFIARRFSRWFALVMVFAMIFDVTIVGFAHDFNTKSIRPFVALINQRLLPGDHVVAFYNYYQDLPFYLQKNVEVVSDWSNKKKLLQSDDWASELAEGILYHDYQQPYLIDDKRLAALWHQPATIYVLTNPSLEPNLQRIVNGRVYTLKQNKRVILLSNAPVTVKLSPIS